MSSSFSAWKIGAVYYVPLLAIAAAIVIVFRTHPASWIALPVFLAGLFVLFFFRDPTRVISATAYEVVAPADGTVVGIEELPESPYFEGPCRRISIFLSIFNVHVNRAPMQGVLTDMRYEPGRYINAMKAESSKVNEANAVFLDTAYGPMTVRQISGAIARRIVCPLQKGDSVSTGEKFGMIKFGSRTELYLSPEAVISVKIKQKVKAGETIMAQFND